LRITCRRWIFTVISLVPISKAICLLSRPETTPESHVQNQASGSVGSRAVHELIRRGKGLGAQTDGFQQSVDRIAHPGIIIDDEHVLHAFADNGHVTIDAIRMGRLSMMPGPKGGVPRPVKFFDIWAKRRQG